jgi:hypothetical protein
MKLDLAKLKELWEAANNGPWKILSDDSFRVCQENEKGQCVCCVALMGNTDDDGEWDYETIERWKANAKLIVELHAAAPALFEMAEWYEAGNKIEKVRYYHKSKLILEEPAFGERFKTGQGVVIDSKSYKVYREYLEDKFEYVILAEFPPAPGKDEG